MRLQGGGFSSTTSTTVTATDLDIRALDSGTDSVLVYAGANLPVNVANSVAVTNVGTFAVQDSQRITDNAVFSDGVSKVSMSGYVFDETVGTPLTENDAAAARIDSKRAQVFVIEDETTRGRRVTVTASNALKVDGSGATQPVSQSGAWYSITMDGTGNALTSHVAGSSRGLDVSIIDGSGNQITSFGGGTQYTEGDIDASITGTAALWEDTSDTLRAVSMANPLPVQPGTSTTWAISAASLPLPTGASTAAKQPALGTAGSASADVLTVQGIASMTALKVDGSAVTQPVSAASLPLPTGAATAAKQPALGTAGSASADVITVQGIASMTALKVDGSAVAQPVTDNGGSLTVDGTIAATQSGNWSVRAQDGGGNNLTSKSVGSARALDIAIVDGSGNQITSFGGGTQYADGAAAGGGTGTITMFQDASNNARLVSETFPLPIQLQAVEGGISLASATNQSTMITALQLIDDIVHSGDAALSKYAVVGAVYDDTSTATVTENQAHALRMSSRRALLVEGVSGGTAITVSASSLPLPTGAATLAEQQTQTTSLQLLDDTVATVGSAVPTKGFAIAGTDGTNARLLKLDSSGEAQVDVLTLPALPAGTNAIGKLAANSGVDIGDVDVPGAANATNGQVTVDTTAGGVTICAARATRTRLIIVNEGTTDVRLGFGSVTTGNGLLLLGVKGANIELRNVAAVKGIVASGSVTVSFIEEYN